jgi:hypothetical protein
MNYQQLGDAAAANKAMKIELQATEAHLHKASWSNESYYRRKYRGWQRVKSILEWLEFKVLDFVWGNGERPLRLCRSVLYVLIAISFFDVFQFGDPLRLDSYVRAFGTAPEVFLGIVAPTNYAKWYLTAITFVRLIAMGFFLSIIIKKFNRR